MVSPTLAPAGRRCPICLAVANPEDVTVRVFAEDGARIRGGIAASRQYLRGIGASGSDRTIENQVISHRDHIERFMRAPYPIAPLERPEGISTIADRTDVKFPTIQQKGMNLGALAIDELARMIETGTWTEEATVLGAAKIGAGVASQRAALAAKGADEKLDILQRMLSGAVE